MDQDLAAFNKIQWNPTFEKFPMNRLERPFVRGVLYILFGAPSWFLFGYVILFGDKFSLFERMAITGPFLIIFTLTVIAGIIKLYTWTYYEIEKDKLTITFKSPGRKKIFESALSDYEVVTKLRVKTFISRYIIIALFHEDKHGYVELGRFKLQDEAIAEKAHEHFSSLLKLKMDSREYLS